MGLAFGLGLALFGAAAGDFDADRGLHQALVVGVRFGLLQLDALLFGLALGVVHTLSLLRQNLQSAFIKSSGRRMWQISTLTTSTWYFSRCARTRGRRAPVLRGGSADKPSPKTPKAWLRKIELDQRMHNVLNQPVNRADLGDHERRVFRF